MTEFPRTVVGGVSVPRLVIGTNWFYGGTHQTAARDRLIKTYQTRERLADTLAVFLAAGIDLIMGAGQALLFEAIHDAEDRVGRKMMTIFVPHFNLLPGGPPELDAPAVFDRCKRQGATFCFPHQIVTDALLDKRAGVIRDLDGYIKMIRERGMIPGLSTHVPETVLYADRQEADVESYLQIYNAAGFLMHHEPEWVMRVIRNAKKPVMCIKPMAAGRLMPSAGLAFVWNTIRDCDMVVAGTASADEAREVIDLSLAFLEHRVPTNALAFTRSKTSLLEVA